MFVIVATIFCLVWQNVQIVKIGHSLTKKQKNLEKLQLNNRMLEIKVANLKSLDRIEAISKQDLGLDKEVKYETIYLKEDKRKAYRIRKKNKAGLSCKRSFARLFNNITPLAQAETLER